MIRTILSLCLLFALAASPVAHSRTFTDTTFRTPDGNLIRKGMSKKDVIAAMRKPDDLMTLTGPKSCKKVELWTYLVDRQVVMLVFTGKNVQQVKILEPAY